MDNVKPGWKTSEFWLSLAAVLLGALLASGALADGGLALKVAGMFASALGALGYQVSRGSVKKAAELGKASVEVAKLNAGKNSTVS